MSHRLYVTPRQAAALDRLLWAYCSTVDICDEGLADLRDLQAKVRRLEQDHSLYYQDGATS